MTEVVRYFNMAADGWGILLSLMGAVILLMTARMEEETRRYLLTVFIVLIADLCSNLLGLLLRGVTESPGMLVLYMADFCEFLLGYVLTLVLSLYLLHIMTREDPGGLTGWRIAVWLLFGVSVVLLVVSQFNGMFYRFEGGVYQRGPLFWLSQAIAMVSLVLDGVMGVRYRGRLTPRERGSLVVYICLPVLALVVQVLYYGIYMLLLACTVASAYAVIAALMDQTDRYYQTQQELTEMRSAMVLSQVQPHFLYNALSAIAQLCEKNPPEAKRTTLAFADYLRMNMNSLNDQKPVPFEKELEHVRTYLLLEQMRFGEELHVVMDIQATDFRIPALTVQPLVENAVKWGVGRREDGGTVTLTTRETENGVEIVVADDGVGFDPEALPQDGRSHLGLKIVRERLRSLCRAELQVQSVPGQGTTMTIRLPREREQEKTDGVR